MTADGPGDDDLGARGRATFDSDMGMEPETGRPGADPRVQAGLDHLQRAAREAIAASRALLDVAEDLIEDPRSAGDLVALLGTLAGQATRLAARAGRPGPAGDPAADRDDDDEPPVERIPVS